MTDLKIEKKSASRGTVTTKYGTYDYEYWAKPIPIRMHDWTWSHEDYDPTPYYYAEGDIPVGGGANDNRLGSAATLDLMVDSIIEYEYENDIRPEEEVPARLRQGV